MISLITAILGALTGMVPGILQLFTQKAANAQAIAIEQLRMQAAKDGIALQIDLANSQSDIQQQQSLYKFAADPAGVRWVDAINTLVRPYITLIVFHVWIGVELALLYYGITKGHSLPELARSVWDENTQAVFSAIVGFWFGNRMLTSHRQMPATLAISTPAIVKATPAKAATSGPVGNIIPDPAGSRT